MKHFRACRAAITLTLLLGVAAACVPPLPPSGGLVGLGEYSGQIANTSVYYQYDGTVGEQLNVGLMVSNIDFMFSESGLNLAVYSPDNSNPPTVRPLSCGVNTCTASYQLPETGRYTIAIEADPLMTVVRTYWLTLSHDEFRGPVPFESPIPGPVLGQELTYSYDGVAGESLNSFLAIVVDPGGNTVLDGTGNATLPSTGTYSVVIRQGNAVLSHDLLGGAIAIGETVTPSLLAGQRVLYTYDGVAGEALGFDIDGGAGLVLLDPADAPLLSISGLPERVVLSATGTHEVIATNGIYLPIVAHLWMSHDVDGGVITPGTVQAPLLDPGQAVAYQYAGTAGETLQVTATKSLAGVTPEVKLFAPDGTELASARTSITSVLSTTDTHLVVVLPSRQDPNVTVSVVSTP